MKTAGIVRRVDSLGRFVLPAELRRTMDIAIYDSLEIYTDGDGLILKKYYPPCTFCNSTKDIVQYRGKNICKSCLNGIVQRESELLKALEKEKTV